MSRLILISMFWLFAKPVKEVQIKGRWFDQIDPKSIIIVTDTKFIEMYGRDTTYSGRYWISTKSCDVSYYKGTDKLDYLSIEDGRCFEITGVSKTMLSYRHTSSGHLHVFKKIIPKIRNKNS